MAKYLKDKRWETIADLNAHAQVANTSLFFKRYTFLEFFAKIGTGLILLAPTVGIVALAVALAVVAVVVVR